MPMAAALRHYAYTAFRLLISPLFRHYVDDASCHIASVTFAIMLILRHVIFAFDSYFDFSAYFAMPFSLTGYYYAR